MTYFIPLFIIVVSACGIIVIFFRRARMLGQEAEKTLRYPEIKNTTEEAPALEESFSKNETSASKGSAFIIFMEKLMRKLRIRLMRLENWLTHITNKLHERRLRKKEQVSGKRDFFEQQEGGSSSDKTAETGEERGENDERASLIALNKQDEKFDEEYWINLLKHDPANGYCYKKLGEIYTAREDFKEARAVLKYALRLDPADEEAKGLLEGLKGKRTRRKTMPA